MEPADPQGQLPGEAQLHHRRARHRRHPEAVRLVPPGDLPALAGADPRRAQVVRMQVGQLGADVHPLGFVAVLELGHGEIIQPHVVRLHRALVEGLRVQRPAVRQELVQVNGRRCTQAKVKPGLQECRHPIG